MLTALPSSMAFSFPQTSLPQLGLALPPVTPKAASLRLPSPQVSPMDIEKAAEDGVRPHVSSGHVVESFPAEQPAGLAPEQRPQLAYFPQLQPGYTVPSPPGAGLEAGVEIVSVPAHGTSAERKRQDHANHIRDMRARQTMWEMAERQTFFVKTFSALVDSLLTRINVQIRTNDDSAKTVDDIISLYNSMRLFLE
ncbi:hypothetical protein LXA43DRAFT_1067794 [Ganoderma leucocontextum]|nr:hypothetical protein LXA43DRAFT_1067794 [Ganoderma leucocontextum]